MAKREKTQEELKQAFITQVEFLEDACKLYDEGNERYAVKIAECLRVFVIDTKSMKSLLTHIGQSGIYILDTAAKPSTMSFYHVEDLSNSSILVSKAYIALVRKSCKSNVWSFSPLFDINREATRVPLQDWLDKVIYMDGTLQLSRSKLIRAIADTDGGAHVDATEDEELYNLKQLNALNLTVNETVVNFQNRPAYASIRQIAFELLSSLPDIQ